MKGSKNAVLFFFFCTISLFIISCAENSITEFSTQSDEFLRKEIVGSWRNSAQRITFLENGTYIDSTYFVLNNTNGWETQAIVKGSYKIVDGILSYYNSEYVYLMDKISVFIGEGYSSALINISNKSLSFVGVDIYHPVGKTDGIFGYWETNKWATSHNSSPNYSGYLSCSYQIDKKTSTYIRQIRFLDDPTIETIEDRDLFEYESPSLKMVSAGKSVVNYTVDFKNDKMYWYQNHKEPYKLNKY